MRRRHFFACTFFLLSVSACSSGLDRQLITAAGEGNLYEVRELLLRGADANSQAGDTGTTPLIAAARNGHVEVAEMLLAGGADINLVDHDVGAALYWAAFEGQDEMVKFMLDKNAKLNCSAASAAYLMSVIQQRKFTRIESLIRPQFQREGFTG